MLTDFFQGIQQFHLIRPLWLVALLPAFLFFILLLRQKLAQSRWQGIIDSDLMPHVLQQQASQQSRWPLWFVLLAWVLASIALAGPSWKQLPQPILKKESALVIVLDMSLSMAAQDLKPERSVRAKQKVIDILSQRREGETALVTYAGEAFVVTPLTDDMETVANLVPALSPFIMPALGSRPDKALEKAQQLLIDTGKMSGKILLITDGIAKKDIKRIKKIWSDKFELSILAVGTTQGAPIALPEKGFLRDNSGAIVLPKLNLIPIQKLASELNSRWQVMSYQDKDWQYLLEDEQDSAEQNEQESRSFDQWSDAGFWLLPLLLVVALFSFRRGWVLAAIFAFVLQPALLPQPVYAEATDNTDQTEETESFAWQDLWQTKDQQAAKLYTTKPSQAAPLFENKDWQGSSYYRAKDYGNALNSFNQIEDKTADQHYNAANSLAQSGNLDEAINSYQQALDLNPDMPDAIFNKELVEKLKQQQDEKKEQEKSDESSDDDSEQQDSDEEKDGEQDKQDSDSDNNEQKDDQQESGEQNKDSQESESQDQQNQQQNSEQEDKELGKDQKDEDQKDEDQKSQAQKDKEQQEQEEKEQQAQQMQESEQDQDGEKQDQTQMQQQKAMPSDLTPEQQQALKQWLNRVPDDPGGLLKRKFLYQYNQQQQTSEEEVLW